MNLDTETKNRLNKRLVEVFPLLPIPQLDRTELALIPSESIWGNKTWIDIASKEYWQWEDEYYFLSAHNEHYYFSTLLKIVINDERDNLITGETWTRIWFLLRNCGFTIENDEEEDEASKQEREEYYAWKALFTPEQRELIREIVQLEIFSDYHYDGELEHVLELWR